MKERMFVILAILCLLFPAVCLAEEENQVDVTLDGYTDAGGMLCVTWTDDACETGGLSLIGTPGQTIGAVLRKDGIRSVEPMMEDDIFEGWMEVETVTTVDEDGFEWETYSLITDPIYSTEELMALTVPDHHVMYVAKWSGVPAGEYFSPCEEEMTVLPSITLLCGEGNMLISGEEEQYEVNWRVVTVEAGQTFGEVLELDAGEFIAPEGKVLAGWAVYGYDAESAENSETPVDEDGVLCFELFEDYHVILREYTVCAGMLSTEELAGHTCEAPDHMVVAIWMAADEYMALVRAQSDAIRTSLENDPLTQTDMNMKSEELRALWDAALTVVLDEAEKVLPEPEWQVLTQAQEAWQASADAAVEAAGRDFAGGSMYALIMNMEAASLTEARVYEICEMLK